MDTDGDGFSAWLGEAVTATTPTQTSTQAPLTTHATASPTKTATGATSSAAPTEPGGPLRAAPR